MKLDVAKDSHQIGKFSVATMVGLAATTTTVLLAVTPARAISFTGNLNGADDTPSFTFTANGTTNVNFRSFSYSGGTNGDGTPIAAGGFSPVITLFDTSDRYIEDVTSSGDFNFDRLLAAGTYRAVISTWPNYFDIPDPFNDPNPLFSLAGFLGGGDFGTDLSGNSLTSAYAFDITNLSATAVPEPTSIIGTAIAGFAAARLKRKLSAKK